MHQYLLILLLKSLICENIADLGTIESSNYQIRNVKSVEYKRTSKGMQLVIQRRIYKFHLQKDKSNFLETTKIVIYGEEKVEILTLSNIPGSYLYEGSLEGQRASSIFGYYFENMFIGIFKHGHKTFYIEPRNEYSYDKNDRSGIMYDVKDVVLKPFYPDGRVICEAMEAESFLKIKSFKEDKHFDSKMQHYNVLIDNKLRIRQTKICSLELVSDYTYSKHMQFNRGKIISQMLLFIKIADSIFRNTDFDGDGLKNDVAFTVDKITILESKNDSELLLGTETNDYKIFLQNLSKYRHSYCMLICFIHRDFWNDSQCAVSKVNKIGGICHDSKASEIHQLGHAFGCHHDPENNRFCSPGDIDPKQGNYIMHPNISYGVFQNNWQFSSCCKNTIKNFFKTSRIKNCLMRRELSTCGNGVVEEGESCDCDSSLENCTAVEKCCTLSEYSSRCTVRKGVTCSPSKGQCCDDNCNIIEFDKKRTCFSNMECFNVTTICDGVSAFCSAVKQPDGTPCRQNSGTCNKGLCNSNVCRDHNMKLCQCKNRHSECHICCRNETSTCQTAKDLHFFPSGDEFYVKMPGTSCNNEHGLCTRNGSCVYKTLWSMYDIWNYLTPVPFVIFIIVAVFCFHSHSHQHKRVSIELLMKKQRLKEKNKRQTKWKIIKKRKKIRKDV
ncbi:disintegrin and metalloproteinase domain-containing protein 10-like isoform X3 [Centruroides vittatus]|uniref:disintegrin and metalloproteinase domain-containing protein 10-like isoform X3 n=1 Tax=Centruroides vittatus TaxID=120091 RepID=UPI003510B0BF